MFTFSQFVDALIKGHGHRYIKRIPYMTPKGRRYRYIYKVTHSHKGKQAIHEDHLQEGTKFMLHTESGKEVHGHIKSVDGDKVTYVIDDGADKGKEVTGTKAEILAMLNERHGVEEQLQEKRDQLKADIEQAKKTGTEKQVARLEAQLKRLGGESAKEEAVTVQEDPERKVKRLKTIIEYANKVQHYILDNKTMDHKGVSRALDRLNDQYMSDDYRNIFLIDEVLAMRPPAPKIDINNIIKDAKKKLKQAEKELKASKKKPAKAKPAKAKPAKAKPAKAKPAKAVDYEKTFKTAPKLLPLNKSYESLNKLQRSDVFEDDNAVAFFETIIDKLKIKKSQKDYLKEMLDKFNDYAFDTTVIHRYNVFEDIAQADDESFSVSRFLSNQEEFNKRAKKIKQGTVIEYPFRELHEKGLGFGLVHDFKTNKKGLGFFVKRGMFQGNAFIMTPCNKSDALGHLSTVLQKLEGAGKLKGEREPFAFLKSVDNFGTLSDQLKAISLIVDDNGDLEDEIARNRLVEDYGEDWVKQVDRDANEAHVVFGNVADDNYDEQASYVVNEQREFEDALEFTKQMSAIAPIYNEIRDHLNQTMDSDVEAEDVRSFIRNNDKAITKYLDKAKEALEAELKKR